MKAIFAQVYDVSCHNIASFQMFWLKLTRNFQVMPYPLNLNVCKVTKLEHLHQSLFLNKIEDWVSATILKRLHHRYPPVNFAQFQRIPISRTFEKDCFCCFFSSFTFFLCKELHNNKDQQFSNYKNVNKFKKNTSLQLLVHCSHKKSFIILVLYLVFSA